jgi:molecular chaperone DnaJ
VKNYYQILKINETATPEEIKNAYRQLAKESHPDKNSGTDEKFRNITEAYDVLKDPKKRALFDKKLTSIKTPKAPARVRKGSDITVSLKVNLNDIINESLKTIITTRMNLCPECLGTGNVKRTLKTCSKCTGTGIDIVSAVIGPKRFCSICKGYGTVADELNCKKCNGSGLIKETIKKSFTLNRENQSTVVIKDFGNYSFGGGAPGNLIVSLICENKGLFEISGKNIKGELAITPAQAVLGDVVSLEVFNSILTIAIPPGTGSGSIIEENDIPFGSGKSKLILKIQILIPQNPNNEEKGLYRHLLKLQKGLL